MPIDETETTGAETIPQDVLDAFSETFNPEQEAAIKAEIGPDDADGDGGVARRNEAKQQADELIQSGEVDEDGNEPVPAPPDEVEEDDNTAPSDDAPAGDEPTIDPNLRFVAAELGWSEDKLNSLFKADPELAESTLRQLADTYTNLSRQYLDPGPRPAIGSPAYQNSPAQPESLTPQLDKLYADLERFSETEGTEIVDRFLKPLQSEIISPLKQLMAQNEAKARDMVRTEARTAMGSLSEKFNDFYGGMDGPSTPQQQQNRQVLGQLADQLRAGARLQGRELSIPDALKRAHLLVTADYREQVVRTELKSQIQTRGRQVTVRPSARNNARASTRSEAKAVQAYEQKAAAMGYEVE